MMIEVFKTDVQKAGSSKMLIRQLLAHWPACKINFDLEDCDKVLRVEGEGLCVNRIIELLKINGHHCEILD